MEQLIVGLFLALFILEFIVEFGLNELNLRYVRAHWAEKRIPDFFQRNMGAAEYEKSVDYTLVKGQFQRWAEIYGRLVVLIVLFGGLLPFMDRFSQDLAGQIPLNKLRSRVNFLLWRCSSFLHSEFAHRSLFHLQARNTLWL